MNKKTIKKVLKAKVEAWLKSIEDQEVRSLAAKNTIVTGGSIASLLLKEKVKDFDVYFRTKEATLAVARYYADKFNKDNPGQDVHVAEGGVDIVDGQISPKSPLMKAFGNSMSVMVQNCEPGRVKILVKSRGVAASDDAERVLDAPFEDAVEALEDADDMSEEVLDPKEEKAKYRPIFFSSNAITLSDRIQLVVRFYGEPDELHTNYDFVHCTNYYDHGKQELVLRPEALEALLAKELKYIGSKYPLCSIIRTRKFIQRGFKINAGQYLKMCFQVSELDLKNINVLEDQLIGVDSAYFTHIIEALRRKMENDPNFNIESQYLTTIIDRVF